MIRRDAKNAEALCLRGSVCAAQHKWPSAIVNFTEAIRLDNQYADAYSRRAAVFDETDQADKAAADRAMAKKLAGPPTPSDDK